MPSVSGIPDGRSALVVGGHQHEVTLEIAGALQRRGDRVAVTYTGKRPAEAPSAYACDVTSQDQVDDVLTRVASTQGPVEVLVASLSLSQDLVLRAVDEEFVSVCRQDLIGTIHLVRKAIVPMRETGGRIVLVRSMPLRGTTQARDGVSELALRGLVSSVVRDEARYGITCNVVTLNAPSPALPWAPTAPTLLDTVQGLTSPQAADVNGQVIPVGNGYRMAS